MYLKLVALHWETQETYKHDDVGKGGKNIFSPQQTEISDREATVNIIPLRWR